MKSFIFAITTKVVSIWKKLELHRLLSFCLMVFILLTSSSYNSYQQPSERPLGERIGEQQHETSVKSERPKTTGEFLEEVEGDVPLGERMENITRDSSEAFQQFGEGITNSIKEGTRELKENLTGK
jgi:hypothetical protein